jgi:16S rRNA A1518/A1519 N6-dimethyltransferase RsmA/KsgA/DIM1 with predicted DNA glycosylase/AP lyase activity
MIEFNADWYNSLIAHSDEKSLLLKKIIDLIQGKTKDKCLEIGLGTTSYFSDNLSSLFKEFDIIETNGFDGTLKENVCLIKGNFENIKLEKKYDVILASHVVYYFKNLSMSIDKL